MKKVLRLSLMIALVFFIHNLQLNIVKAADVSDDEEGYIIKFDPKNGEEIREVKVEAGEQLTEDDVPFERLENEEKDFLGWFYGEENEYGESNRYNVIFPLTFTPGVDIPPNDEDKEFTLIAKWGTHHEGSPINKPGYRMIFNDEFDNTDGKLDPTKWVENYLSSWTRTPEHAKPVYELNDSVMSLQIREDTVPWAPEYDQETVVSGFTTGNRNAMHNWNGNNEVRNPVETELTHINQYGYYEIRSKAQAGSSRHAAWWLLGFEDEPTHSAEIDMFEVLGNNSNGVPRAFHNWQDPKAFDIQDDGQHHYGKPSDDFHNEYHIYGMDWQEGTGEGNFPDKLVFYIDGEEVGSKNTNITYPMIQLFSLYEKRHDGWTGPWEWMPYPNSFDIDYVRVYKKLPDGQEKLPEDQLEIISIEDSTVEVMEGQAELKTIVSKVVGEEGTVYTEPNLPNTKSYVNVTWNDGIITQEFVKWDPITIEDLDRINNGEEIIKKGKLPNVDASDLSDPVLKVKIVEPPQFTSENLGSINDQSQLAKLFDGNFEDDSGEFKFDQNKLPDDKEVNIQYDFRQQVTLNSIDFTTNFGMDQGIKKFKLASWDEEANDWVNLDEEYEIGWSTSEEQAETVNIALDEIKTSKIKIIITDVGLTWYNKVAMRQIVFNYDIDRSELEDLLADATSISNENGKYTSASFGSLQNAIEKVESALDAIETEEELATAIKELQDAIDGLEPVETPEEPEPTLDLTELEELIIVAISISNEDGKYTSASFGSLQNAIEKVESALDAIETEEELATAIKELKDAIDGLEPIEEDKTLPSPEKPKEPANPEDPVLEEDMTPETDVGNELPKTATTMYTLMTVGLLLIGLGVIAWFLYRRRVLKNE